MRDTSDDGSRGCKGPVQQRLTTADRGGGWRLAMVLLWLGHSALCGQESWPAALGRMPLGTNVTQLDRFNCVPLLLGAFRSDPVVKALVFMPGATDEFYMFRRAKATLTNAAPTLLDAVSALTNQTQIRARFVPPFLLLHSEEDPLDLRIAIEHQPTADRLKAIPFAPHLLYFDKDWDFVQPVLKRTLKLDVRPWRYSQTAWHFYRHSLAGWNLTGWETLQALAFAGKTGFKVRRPFNLLVPHCEVEFFGDERALATPVITDWPRP